MTETVDTLILDLLEWLDPAPRPYPEVLDVRRTSCPRLPVWEEVNERGLVDRRSDPSQGTVVAVSVTGAEYLRQHRYRIPGS